MLPEINRSTAARLMILALISVLLILALAGLQSKWVQAEADGSLATKGTKAATATRTTRPEKVGENKLYSRLCGQLVFLTDRLNGQQKLGLKPCGSGKPFIFEKHPRDIVAFYQLRDAEVRKGSTFDSSQFGPLNKYIITYKNYVGITSCSECGLYGVLPTWTRPPLFTNTPTPAPTKTTSLPSSTPTETATLAPLEVTETYSMFELLYGTETPTPTPSESPTPTPLPTKLPAAIETTPSTSAVRTNLVLVFGIGLVIILVILAYLIWISSMRSRPQ